MIDRLSTDRIYIVTLIVMIFMLLSACAPATQNSDSSSDDQNAFFLRVSKVIDGDTIRVSDGRSEETVRLIGVNTPETNHPSKGEEPFGAEAKSFTMERLDGQLVQLLTDVEERDKYGRLLAYVYLEDGTFFNEVLVREGYAQVMTITPNVKFAERFVELERTARSQGKGLWASAALEADRDCADFRTQREAQSFFISNGGPEKDRHRLDVDGDGRVCERLP